MEASAATVRPAADVWRERVQTQQAGGQSIRAWCRDNCLNEHAFYAWRHRLGLSTEAATKRRRNRQRAFTELLAVVPAPPAAAGGEPPVASLAQPMLLRLAGGRGLELPASLPIERIAALLRAIERPA